MFKKSLAFIILLAPLSILATEKIHHFGFSFGIGGTDSISNDSDLSDSDPSLSSTNIVYGYQMVPEWVLEVGYLSADTESFDFIFENLFLETDIEVQAVHVGIKGVKSLTEHNDLYVRVRLNRYDVELSLQDSVLSSDTGTSFGYSAGWQFNFENDIGLNLEYSRSDFDHLEIKTLNLGVNFSF